MLSLSPFIQTIADFLPCKIPPCKVLVIGAGVAGLSAIATASNPIVDYDEALPDRTSITGKTDGCHRTRLRYTLGCS